MNKIKKIKIYYNNNDKSEKLSKELSNKLIDKGFIIDNDNYDLAICIGGDGGFLRLVNYCEYDDRPYYVGINSGTLGFACEIMPEEIDCFIDNLVNMNFKVEEVALIETKVYVNDNVKKYYSLNETIIRDANYEAIRMKISIDNELFENFLGDGILVCNSFGSTAYNLSLNGSIIYSGLDIFEMTFIAPINNKCYRNITNSIILPSQKVIKIETLNDIVLSVDGRNTIFKNVDKVEFKVGKKIKLIRVKDYDYTKKIYEKFTS